MSKKRNIVIKCPNCSKEYPSQLWDSYNLQEEQGNLEPIIDDSIVTHTCPFCHQSAVLLNQLMFHDMDKRLMIFFLPGDTGENDIHIKQIQASVLNLPLMKDYVIRATEEKYLDFKEKILQLESGLDDRVCELYKQSVVHCNKPIDSAHILFEHLTPIGIVALYGDKSKKVFKFDQSEYDKIYACYLSRLTAQPLIVNQKYASFVMEEPNQ